MLDEPWELGAYSGSVLRIPVRRELLRINSVSREHREMFGCRAANILIPSKALGPARALSVGLQFKWQSPSAPAASATANCLPLIARERLILTVRVQTKDTEICSACASTFDDLRNDSSAPESDTLLQQLNTLLPSIGTLPRKIYLVLDSAFDSAFVLLETTNEPPKRLQTGLAIWAATASWDT
ncbi:hypothetical protein B0H17DRAFT_1139206 [Mycena rosella]|uniref:Uncharacterized protein n=1 Tax=Mycena rosella TaxID=1033263 RepID=A0AAD7D4R7_MYCRO|nr:hypothetical protein B0H17DRAFT_1139206 [Mycena rosella]